MNGVTTLNLFYALKELIHPKHLYNNIYVLTNDHRRVPVSAEACLGELAERFIELERRVEFLMKKHDDNAKT